MELNRDEIEYILKALEEYPWSSDKIDENELGDKLKNALLEQEKNNGNN